MQTHLRTIGYLRVSVAVQESDGMGLDVQREAVNGYLAEHRELELVQTVQEIGSAGVGDDEVFAWDNRPVMLSLLERAQASEFDVLLVARLDRLCRDHVSFTVLERMLRQHGVRVLSVLEEENGDNQDPTAKLVRSIQALLAEYESETIRLRLRAGKALGRKQGRHVEGRPAYGYDRGSDGKLVPSADAALVRRIFTDAKEGLGLARIARDLTNENVLTPRGKPEWSIGTVKHMLRSAVYAGELHGQKRTHQSIISRQLFNTVQRKLEARTRSTPERTDRS